MSLELLKKTVSTPLETLYLNNLNEKISINKLKSKIDSIFSTYGKIIQITAHKNLKMKGQAFVTYESPAEAGNALKKLQNFIIFDKPVRIQFSTTNSDNHYKIKNPTNEEIPEIIKRKESKIQREQSLNKRKLESLQSSNSPSSNAPSFEVITPAAKKIKVEDWKSLPPNNILLIQNLPSTTTKEILESTFQEEDGFINIRLVKIRNLAFIEFDNDSLSTDVLKKFNSKILTEIFSESTILTYAKK